MMTTDASLSETYAPDHSNSSLVFVCICLSSSKMVAEHKGTELTPYFFSTKFYNSVTHSILDNTDHLEAWVGPVS